MGSVLTPDSQRQRYIDWARGLAVLIMIEAHTLDSWTRPAGRHGFWFDRLSILGGFAAPLFLWLAGLSLVLSAERRLARTSDRPSATALVVRRGVEIFILAFLFRLQAFFVSPGSWLITIFRVDILNIMGPSLAGAGLLWGVSRRPMAAVLTSSIVAIAIAMVTPLVRTAAWVDVLPTWLQWHIRPFGDHTTFTLFPWAGFVFAGAATGAALAKAGSAEARLLLGLLVAGICLVWLGFWTAGRPSIYPVSSFWTTSPTFFAIRLGVLMVTLGLLFLAQRVGRWRLPGVTALETLGRNSLFIYWIHVELVYGGASILLRRRLPLWGTLLGCLALWALMYAAVPLRDRAIALWRQRGMNKSSEGAVPA